MSVVRSGLATVGGFAAGLAWHRRARLRSIAVRALSNKRPNAATRSGIHVDLGPPASDWSRPPLAASLDHALSDVLGRPVEGAAYSRFGDFALRQTYSRFLDPDSLLYQAWLGAYVVLGGQDGRFGFRPDGSPNVAEALAVLEADQRLVYRSTGCSHRFDDGRCTRPVGEVEVVPDEEGRWVRFRGEAETWSSYCRGGSTANGWGRALYGVVPANATHEVDDFHPLRYVGVFWIRHDEVLSATCCAFVVVPRFVDRIEVERFPGEVLLRHADEVIAGIRFERR